METGTTVISSVQISDEKFQEVVEYFNDHYGMNATLDMFKETITDSHLRLEIVENGYTDTCQRDLIVDKIVQKYIGMSWPLYGDSDEYKSEFENKAKEVGLLKAGSY